jgi:hypothetical protein
MVILKLDKNGRIYIIMEWLFSLQFSYFKLKDASRFVGSLCTQYVRVRVALNFITKFHKIWYEYSDIRGYPNLVFFTFIQM